MNNLFPNDEIYLKLHCPNCSELLPFETKRCKYCYEEVDDERSEFNTAVYFVLTAANSTANSVGTNDPAVLIYLGTTLLSLLLKWMFISDGLYYVWVVLEVFNTVWFLPLIAILLWFYFHGRWNILDDEYEQKKKAMRQSLAIWLAAYVFHYAVTFAVI